MAIYAHRVTINGQCFVGYLDDNHGGYAQYHGAQAGAYRSNVSRKARRLAEIAAHSDGLKNIPRLWHRFAAR